MWFFDLSEMYYEHWENLDSLPGPKLRTTSKSDIQISQNIDLDAQQQNRRICVQTNI